MSLPTSWQDWVLSIGSLLFVIALLPSIFGKDKPALKTCVLTAIVMTAFSITYGSLGLWYTMFTSAIVTIEWYILWYQKIRQK
jgi:hypothetical protein